MEKWWLRKEGIKRSAQKLILIGCGVLVFGFAQPATGTDMLIVTDTGDNTQFVVTDTGVVGVGTPTPNAPVHVKKDQNAPTAFRVENANIIGLGAASAQEQVVLGPSGS